ncbi:MAG: flagellar biosynthesis protein FlgA [Thermoprotei archaeon]|nr:MAG: flagellar biosynthesis protein FlgA [Thermoprotei archaeon]
MGETKVLVLHPEDNVAVALTDLRKGEKIRVVKNGRVIELVLKSDVPFGHKVALEDIPKCGYVVKYGNPIGRAKVRIQRGEHVHVRNLESTYVRDRVCRDE